MMGSITGDLQALILKMRFRVRIPSALLSTLGARQHAYMGPAGEDGDALVVPWAVLTEYISHKRIVEYTVDKRLEVTDTQTL
jgi:hypothetical protein